MFANNSSKKIKAFSLIEMSIVLVVIGLIAGAVFKGRELLENAKIRSIASDLQQYDMAINNYQETYHALPGDDPKASKHFSSTDSGDGNGQIIGREADLFWQHLYKATLIGSNQPPTSKLGGTFTIVYQPHPDMPGNWLMLSKEGSEGILTPNQAQKLKKTIEHGDSTTNPSQGQLIVKDGKGSVGRCISSGTLNLDSKTPDCVVYYRF